MDLAFSKERAVDRKYWLENEFDPRAFVNPHKKHVSVTEFINTDSCSLVMRTTFDQFHML